jgi:hypothetical protein
MKKHLIVLVGVIALAATARGQQPPPGFKLEPGISIGTPCVLNLMARFWYGSFGISTCGIYSPAGFSYFSGGGGEADFMFKPTTGRRQMIEPYIAVGGGFSSISTTLTNPRLNLTTSYVGLQVGAYYSGGFAQLGLGIGSFRIAGGSVNSGSSVWPLFKIGYLYAIGSSPQGGK